MEHASSNGGMMTPNGHHIMSSLPCPTLRQGMAYHLAVPASPAELLRYHPHLPAGSWALRLCWPIL